MLFTEHFMLVQVCKITDKRIKKGRRIADLFLFFYWQNKKYVYNKSIGLNTIKEKILVQGIVVKIKKSRQKYV